MAGKRSMKMVQLRAALEKEDCFQSVRTLIASGNVVFQSKEGAEVLSEKMSEVIEKEFGYDDVPVMTRSAAQLRQAMKSNPFLQESIKPTLLFAVMLNDNPCPTLLAEMTKIDYTPEKFSHNADLKMIYFVSSKKYKLDTTVFEKKLQILGTNRNWNTMNRSLKLVEEVEAQPKDPLPITAFFKPKPARNRLVTPSPPPEEEQQQRRSKRTKR